MMLVDTHSHIYLPELADDLATILERAEKEGVSRILMPAIDAETHEAVLATEKAHPGTCYAMMGLHPCSVKANYADELKIARDYFEKKSFKAVGEIGLDFYWDLTFKEQQYAAFHEQIGWALQYDIPVVIHSRNSLDECINVVTEHQKGKLRGVFHCFSGTIEQAKKIIGLGFYMGIGGVVTFKNSGLDKVMNELDLENIVLETDTPYLAPAPFRGKRNEPSYLKYVVEKMVEIKKMSKEEIAKKTTANAERLFGL
jgi:TatD DNase family protein